MCLRFVTGALQIAHRLMQKFLPGLQSDTLASPTQNTSLPQSQSEEPIMSFADFRVSSRKQMYA